MEGTQVRGVGENTDLQVAVASLIDDDLIDEPLVIVLVDTTGTGAGPDGDHGVDDEPIRLGIVGLASELQSARSAFGESGGRIVVVHPDPSDGPIAARAAAAGARSLIGSLAVEWAPLVGFATVITDRTHDPETVAGACRFAAAAPIGTTVHLGSDPAVAST